MYASPGSRDADIAAGATRGAQEIFTDLNDSAARFASAAASLEGAPEMAEVEMRGGRVVRGAQLPTLRLMEVVFHHVDLDAGYTFAAADPGFVKRAITIAVERFRTRGQVPSITLLGEEDETWTLGGGAQHISGTNAVLLLWLARGQEYGLTSAAPLPRLPSWG